MASTRGSKSNGRQTLAKLKKKKTNECDKEIKRKSKERLDAKENSSIVWSIPVHGKVKELTGG